MDPLSLSPPVFDTHLRYLKKIHQGKVRDIYEVDAEHLLIVTTDRLSAFDVILPDPIPGKGEVLTRISQYWFDKTRHIVPNQLTSLRIEDVISDADERALLAGRAMIVQRLAALPIEAVVRGYLIGSGYKDYVRTGSVCGVALPPGLAMSQKLDEAVFTPAYKAPAGQHDENIDFEGVVAQVGRELASQIRSVALDIYRFAVAHAHERNIIIADTKFEFGIDEAGNLKLIDEVLTPDSSRFWPVESYAPGTSPPSFDKQFVRDYLESLPWNKSPPAPRLPVDIIARTSANYRKALELLTA